MKNFIVVNDVQQWPGEIVGVDFVDAQTYLRDPLLTAANQVRIYNLCDSYCYQRMGYYVSLLAEARGQKPVPRARTIEDLQSAHLVRLLTEPLDEWVQLALQDQTSHEMEWDFYFGLRPGFPEDVLGQQLFKLLQAPLLRTQFEKMGERWQIRSARAISIDETGVEAIPAIFVAAKQHLSSRNGRSSKNSTSRYEIAILHDPAEAEPPSNPHALQKFAEAADTLGMHAEIIGRHDFGRLAEFDGLFIRDTTRVNHYTYRFARQAAAEGLVVIDDPDSILKCSNKVYLAELLTQRGIPAPKSLVVHRGNIDQVFATLGSPCILKQPDSAFSAGVSKVNNEDELRIQAEQLFLLSDLFIAQEYLPTDFDWRIGVLDRRVLFVAKYFMAPGHWQIIKRDAMEPTEEGPTSAFSISEAPGKVLQQALRAANSIGDGLYGVDVKHIDDRAYVIEVNDNPNLDAGNEDSVLKDALYREVMGVFFKRIDARKRGVAA